MTERSTTAAQPPAPPPKPPDCRQNRLWWSQDFVCESSNGGVRMRRACASLVFPSPHVLPQPFPVGVPQHFCTRAEVPAAQVPSGGRGRGRGMWCCGEAVCTVHMHISKERRGRGGGDRLSPLCAPSPPKGLPQQRTNTGPASVAGIRACGGGWHNASVLDCLSFGGAYWPLATAHSVGPNVFWLCQWGGGY